MIVIKLASEMLDFSAVASGSGKKIGFVSNQMTLAINNMLMHSPVKDLILPGQKALTNCMIIPK